jgi:hypothetical protein
MKDYAPDSCNDLVLAVGSHCCEAACLDALEPLFERLHRCPIPRRDKSFVSQGGIKSNTPTHHQLKGLSRKKMSRGRG